MGLLASVPAVLFTSVGLVAAQQTNANGNLILGGFIPKLWPTIVGIVLYSLSGLVHWFFWFKTLNRGGRFMLILPIGMSCIVIGLIIRIPFSHDATSLGLYIGTDLLILLSPCAFLATDYLIIRWISRSIDMQESSSNPDSSSSPKSTTTLPGADCLLIPEKWIVRLFVGSDISTFLLQSGGGGLSAKDSLANLGKTIALIGLILQLASFALFTLILLLFGWRLRSRYPEVWAKESTTGTKSWKILFWATCLSTIGILIRSAHRIKEYSEGYFGFLAIHEGYFWLLDALPLWISMTIYCFIWPPLFLQLTTTKGKGDYAMETHPTNHVDTLQSGRKDEQ